MHKKGITLIELLVVIAIIGILSSVAIVYLSDARKKANDAKVASNVTTASTQLEINRANGEAIDATAVTAVITKLGTHPCSGTWSEDHDTDFSNVAIYSTLCSDTGAVFCADSVGFRGSSTVPTTDSGQCQ